MNNMDKPLTLKQKGFVKDYVATGNKARAVMNHYNTNDVSVASQIGTENTRKPHIQRAIAQLMENAKLDDKSLLGKHLELLNKKEVIVRYNKNGEVDIIQTGEIDVNAVSKALDMAYKIKGYYTNEKRSDERPINIAMILKEYGD